MTETERDRFLNVRERLFNIYGLDKEEFNEKNRAEMAALKTEYDYLKPKYQALRLDEANNQHQPQQMRTKTC